MWGFLQLQDFTVLKVGNIIKFVQRQIVSIKFI